MKKKKGKQIKRQHNSIRVQYGAAHYQTTKLATRALNVDYFMFCFITLKGFSVTADFEI